MIMATNTAAALAVVVYAAAAAHADDVFLCLHGGGQDHQEFVNMIQPLISAAANVQCEFLAAPYTGSLWIRDPPGGKDVPTTQLDWADDSYHVIDNKWDTAQYRGIMGYSQGAAIVPYYLAYRIERGKPISQNALFVLFNGYIETAHQGLYSVMKKHTPLPYTALIYDAVKDHFYDLSTHLINAFSTDKRHVVTGYVGEHHPPAQENDPAFGQVVHWINAHTQQHRSQTEYSAGLGGAAAGAILLVGCLALFFSTEIF